MMPKKIDELWAWVREDQGDGEGVLAAEMVLDGRTMFVPFVGADRERIESYRAQAQDIARRTGRKVHLIRYSTREVIE